MAKTKTKKKTKKPGLTSGAVSKHWLYEKAVQNPEAEVEFIDRAFHDEYGHVPDFLREDFCGTAYLSCTWVAHRESNSALGVDLDGPTLDYGREHHAPALGGAVDRLRLVQADVREVAEPRADVVAATNFSWWCFHDRRALVSYLRKCRAALRDEGMLMLDIYGGPEAQVPQLEERDCEGFTYVWDQDEFNPITHAYRCKIHFRFPDGTEMTDAFTYDWRLWSIPEARELLLEAGFRKTKVYWEGADEDGEPDGVFVPSEEGDTSSAWVAYVVAFR